MRHFWVNIHYACFGIDSKDNIIVAAAPIAKWMIGKSLQEIKPWLLKKKAVVKEYELQRRSTEGE